MWSERGEAQSEPRLRDSQVVGVRGSGRRGLFWQQRVGARGLYEDLGCCAEYMYCDGLVVVLLSQGLRWDQISNDPRASLLAGPREVSGLRLDFLTATATYLHSCKSKRRHHSAYQLDSYANNLCECTAWCEQRSPQSLIKTTVSKH